MKYLVQYVLWEANQDPEERKKDFYKGCKIIEKKISTVKEVVKLMEEFVDDFDPVEFDESGNTLVLMTTEYFNGDQLEFQVKYLPEDEKS